MNCLTTKSTWNIDSNEQMMPLKDTCKFYRIWSFAPLCRISSFICNQQYSIICVIRNDIQWICTIFSKNKIRKSFLNKMLIFVFNAAYHDADVGLYIRILRTNKLGSFCAITHHNPSIIFIWVYIVVINLTWIQCKDGKHVNDCCLLNQIIVE